MVESIENFFNRIYVDFVANVGNYYQGRVLVWSYKRGLGKAEIWTLEDARQYLRYLQQQEMEI